MKNTLLAHLAHFWHTSFTHWLLGALIVYFIHCFIAHWIDCTFDSLIAAHWSDCLLHSLLYWARVVCTFDWLIDCTLHWLRTWSTDWLHNWWTDWFHTKRTLVSFINYWMIDWFVTHHIKCRVNLFINWLHTSFTDQLHIC